MPNKIKRLTGLLFVFALVFTSFGWNKGPISDSTFTSIYIDMYLNLFKFHTTGKTWNETAKDYDGMTYTREGDLNYPNQISWPTCAQAIAIDGSDAQVAQTGLTRDELFRRVSVTTAPNYSKGPKTKAAFDSAITRARTVFAAPRITPTGFALRPAGASYHQTSLAWNDRMDYGNSRNWITTVFVPQDLADPRLIGGRPIKEWLKNYWWGSTGGDFIHPTPFVEANYSPDFSNDHHYFMEPFYSACQLDSWHTGIDTRIFTQLNSGTNLDDDLTSPYNHLKDLWKWFAILTAPNGWFVKPHSFNEYVPYRTYRDESWASAIYRDPVARALAARSIEEHAKRKPIFGRYAHETEVDAIASAYWMHRLLGGSDTALSYTDAVKRLHGTYWFRNYRYAVHRSPDKMVVVSWSGVPRCSYDYLGIQATGNDSLLNYVGLSNRDYSYLGTTVIADNDSLRPDSETAFPIVYNTQSNASCMQGNLDGFIPTPHGTKVRNDRNDAVLNTTGMLPYPCDRYGGARNVAYQYQSMTSLYDKTCISLVKILPGERTVCNYGGSGPSRWLQGFGNAIITDAALGEKRDLYYEQGQVDLTTLSASQNLSTSTWWCVNGRLGVAVKSASGQFGITPVGNSNVPPSTIIGWNMGLSSGRGEASAAYFTNTPPEKVKYLQSTMTVLDGLLPSGWKGLVTETPDSQRAMAVARFRSDSSVARLALSFPEGGPVLESVTKIRDNNSVVTLVFDSLQTLGQTVAFYVTGESDTVIARQIGDITVELKGTGSAKLVYLSRADNNTVYVGNVQSTMTKAELKAGITVDLTSDWTVVRVSNWIDEDHTGPAVEMISPQYYRDEQTEMIGGAAMGGTPQTPLYQPDSVTVPASGLPVSVMAKDRSGISWIKVYLDWDSAGIISRNEYEMDSLYACTIAQDKFGETGSIHAIFAVACDIFGNLDTSVTVPFCVKVTGGTGIEVVKSTALMVTKNVNQANISQALSMGSTKAINGKTMSISNGNNFTVEGKVNLSVNGNDEKSGIHFQCQDREGFYVFALDAEKRKVKLSRVENGRMSLLGEAQQKVTLNQWYKLKMVVDGAKMTGYVDGVEKFVIIE